MLGTDLKLLNNRKLFMGSDFQKVKEIKIKEDIIKKMNIIKKKVNTPINGIRINSEVIRRKNRKERFKERFYNA